MRRQSHGRRTSQTAFLNMRNDPRQHCRGFSYITIVLNKNDERLSSN